MIREHVKTTQLSTAVICLAAFVCLFINRTISAGLILGHVFYVLYLLVLTGMIDTVLKNSGRLSPAAGLGFILRIFLLALPMVIAALFPNIFNLFAVFASLFINRFMLLVLYARGEES